MHSPVPKVRKGVRASLPLKHVYIDLCGPMPFASKTGHLYSMNVIDDHTSYVWSLPLKLKLDAATALYRWHYTMENQLGHKLKKIVTDNSELVSKTITNWCSTNGINHQCTTPYTSAHNSWAERLHRTILGRAWPMCLACNVPASLWDEFWQLQRTSQITSPLLHLVVRPLMRCGLVKAHHWVIFVRSGVGPLPSFRLTIRRSTRDQHLVCLLAMHLTPKHITSEIIPLAQSSIPSMLLS